MTRSVITFNNVESKPTTRAGYGITDAASNAAQYAVSYLVIGGGGQGSTSLYNDGAGGGAGGYRSNWRENQRDGQLDRQQFQTWSGAYSPPEPELFLTVGTTYTVTIGAGGTAYTRAPDTEFGPIFASGGGSAGSHRSSSYDGGSGGGGGGYYTSGDVVTGGYPVRGQGYEGGTKTDYPGGGGGGGAGGAGQGGSGNSKNGGSGIASNITGSVVTRAGGGANHAGSGGSGGGGGPGSNGTANTGSGGGGNQSSGARGFGGSGVVILRMPTANYSGTTTGSPTVSTFNNDTVLTFTSSGSYTA